ncbi:choline dehydrogenase [Cribrihabitans marinus]|uniref:Choline dehydrogenase n=1 Tax=Cribrihabitans marinus TaxID=1227549 RepID=A0A1H6T016_9RHOB|nr:GMC family oxidoreductase N-terminal domain-containing protein [Cribrihabitans marinus]GGH22828.1 choline dehydrogenase [Cribrihabitans marinus]SEI71454.1 choline dehydrogenase [Cribrihabitans marinus]
MPRAAPDRPAPDASDATEGAEEYDYVIVGGGTAGCVLANRLSADPACRVLLLEAGGSDRYHWVQIPVGYLYCIGNPRVDWMMKTAPEPGLGGRSLVYPRGKVLGGCSSINGMIYMRGQAADYDGWRQMGNTGWGWDDVLPYFRRSEAHHAGETPLHGADGEWPVSTQRVGWDILRAVQAGAAEFGWHPTDDFNAGSNEGTGFFEVNQRRGLRWNTTRAFLRPAMRRRNLRVLTGALTERLLLDGRRVTGVAYRHRGRARLALARAEVLLAAGAINSPKLLELSGIGQPDRLAALGIAPRHDLPGVGENLQDHLQIRTVFKVSGTTTLNELSHSMTARLRMAAQFALTRSGPLSMAPSQFGMFTRSDPALATPDLEYHVQPLSTDRLGDPLHRFPAITVSVCNLRPESVGHCHITRNDADPQPEIVLNYLSAPRDRQVTVTAIRQARRLMTARALARHEPREFLPGPKVQSEAELVEAAGRIATTIFHPVGTCKMGQDRSAVVAPDLRVHGLGGLRVVDASIMPRIVSGNTASPVIMIAEKAADMILGRD